MISLESLTNIVIGLAIVLVFMLVSVLSVFLTQRYVAKFFKQKVDLQRYIIAIVKGPITLLFVSVGIVIAMRYWRARLPVFFPWWLEEVYLITLIQVLFVILVVRLVSSAIKKLLAARSEVIAKRSPELAGSIKLLYWLIVYLTYIIGVIVVIYLILSSPFISVIKVELLYSVLIFITGLTITFIATYAVNHVMTGYVQELVSREPKLVTIYTFLRRLALSVIIFTGAIIATFAAFPAAGAALASLLIAAGFVSIVVGLAAQSSLSNIISGITISLSQPFRIGDAVVFRNDFCFVEDIKLSHTVLRTWDNRRLMVPNSILQSEVIINYSINDPTMLVPLTVQVSYESDLEKAMNIMVDIARKHPDFLPAPDLPQVVVMEFADSGIVLRLLSRAKDQPTAFMMARDLLFQIKKEFDANGIEIPYPRRFLVLDRRMEYMFSKLIDVLQAWKKARNEA